MHRRPAIVALLLLGVAPILGCGVPELSDAAPRARLSTPMQASVGVPVLLDASASFDPDGVVAAYTFWAGDGRPSVTMATPELRHTFESPGAFEVAVVVRDAAGQLSRATQLVVVVEAQTGCRETGDCPIGGECRGDEGLCFAAPGGDGGLAECERAGGCAEGRDCRGGLCLRPMAVSTP